MRGLNEVSLNDVQILPPSIPEQRTEDQGAQRILVVEDDVSLAHLEADVLTACGYDVMIVESGELAITTISQSIPDLVVLDFELAGNMNGWDVFQVLRQHTNIPVLLTSSLGMHIRKHFPRRGETRLTLDHLPKPYPMQTLLKRVSRMLMIAPQ